MDNVQLKDGVYETAIPICVENVGFDMFGKLMGADGKNMIYIEGCTGVGLHLDGESAAFINPNPNPGPLRLVIQHATEQNVAAAVPLVEHLVSTVQSGYEKYVEGILRQDPHIQDDVESDLVKTHPHFVQIPLKVEPTKDFNVFEHLMGADGNNLTYIEQCTDASLGIEGEASRDVNADAADGPLRVVIRHETEDGLAEAVPLVESLIEVVQEEYKDYLTAILQGSHSSLATKPLYCKVCELQFEKEEEFKLHCAGALHARNEAQREKSLQKSPQDNGSGASPLDLDTDVMDTRELYRLTATQVRFFTNLLIYQSSTEHRHDIKDKVIFQTIPKSTQETVKAKARNKSYCIVCEQDIDTGSYVKINHYTQRSHRMKYLNLQAKHGPGNFHAVYGNVPLPGINAKGGLQFAVGVMNTSLKAGEVPNCDKYGYEDMIVLAGIHSAYYCQVCQGNMPKNVQVWMEHVQSRQHAEACIKELTSLGPYHYLEKHRYVPAPVPSTVQKCPGGKTTTPDETEESLEQVPEINKGLWTNLKKLVSDERDIQNAVKKAESNPGTKRGQSESADVPAKRSRADERLDSALIRHLQIWTQVEDVKVLEEAVEHMRRQKVDLHTVLQLLESDQMKAVRDGETENRELAMIVHKIVNFTGQT